MSNDLHQLHQEADASLVRNLSKRLPGLCRSAGDISQAAETSTRGSLVSTDEAQGKPDAFGNLGSNKTDESSGHRQQERAPAAIKNIDKGDGVTA